MLIAVPARWPYTDQNSCNAVPKLTVLTFTGVESFDIDLKEQKVTVKGNVQPEAVLQTVAKTGKKTAFWEDEALVAPAEPENKPSENATVALTEPENKPSETAAVASAEPESKTSETAADA